ncbi:Zinc/iron permease [Elsinoe ampelina]|uniref:Zinc/iron permease n=1 Tax=Elsinoe ampelina TaxID=302913 RepID=A0A6A6FZN5_9PEZI|nr:Zinc/iron permease [Elsinoe ampelina]
MGFSNDTRGWIMTSISGVACVLGAAIICADIIVRQFPGKKDFRIQDSDAFLSASLSLSFGVMLFSALYKMLPSAKNSLHESGMSPKVAAWVLIICFIGGAAGIQLVSRVLHHYIPSHVVDCEHTHDEEDQKEHSHSHSHSPSRKFRRSKSSKKKPHSRSEAWPPNVNGNAESPSYFGNVPETPFEPTREMIREETFTTAQTSRPSLRSHISRTLSKLSTAPTDGCKCDSKGPCHGFTDPCGKDCFKIVQSRGSFSSEPARPIKKGTRPKIDQFQFPSRHTHHAGDRPGESTPLLADIRESGHSSGGSAGTQTPKDEPAVESTDNHNSEPVSDSSTLTPYDHAVLHRHKTSAVSDVSVEEPQQHHHHVPTNAFLSIGLQTSIAIALHKLPEGFITYATNHANPRLGFSVFLALFIHNITEGFAMALPLYLALQSRWKAMAWSALLGGFSQPLGAGIAALWFKIAGHTNMAPGEGVYGGMFAVTSGIMTSVALSLFSESLDLTHSRGLCMVFAFVGMGIMGVSSALTA